MLSLTGSLALLALDESSGRPYGLSVSALPHALSATIIVDLLDGGFIEMDDQEHLTALPGRPSTPLLAAAWESIRDDGEPRTVGDWVAKPNRLVDGLPGVAYGQLVVDGTLDGDIAAGVLQHVRHREGSASATAEMVAELERTLDEDQPAGADDVVLLSLVEACRLVPLVFPDRNAVSVVARIDQLVAAATSRSIPAVEIEGAVPRDVVAAVAVAAVNEAVAGASS